MQKFRLSGILCALILAICATAMQVKAQSAAAAGSVTDAALDSVVTILLTSDGQTRAVGSGLIVRSDGYVLTALSLVRGSRDIQVRLRNGETFDKGDIATADERRNVAIIRIPATGLHSIPNGTVEESQVGSAMRILSNPSGQVSIRENVMLNAVQMADSIPGAGRGYRVLQFGGAVDGIAAGGLLLDDRGRSIGIVTTTPETKGQNIAVPLTSVAGLIRSVQEPVAATSGSGLSTYPAPAQTPAPIPQSSVLVPQRGITPLSAKGPGSVVVKPSSVTEILAASKTIYVSSRTTFFKPDQLVNELNKQPELADWGLTFVDERDLADLILEVDHVLFTWKFTFKLYSQRLGTVVATGSRIILDGNLGAPAMAERVVEKMKSVREPRKTPNVNDKESGKSKSTR